MNMKVMFDSCYEFEQVNIKLFRYDIWTIDIEVECIDAIYYYESKIWT